MKRILVISFFSLLVATTPVFAASVKTYSSPYASSTGEFAAAIVMTAKTHQILYQFKQDDPWPAASLTKLANALAFVHLKPNWNRRVRILPQDEVGGGRLRAVGRSLIPIKDLFFSSITASANNAAMALARVSGLSRSAFLVRMNREAKQSGATHSHFVDPAGMNPANMTTARDVGLITGRAFQDKMIRQAASASRYEFTLASSGIQKVLKSTSDVMMQDPDVIVLGGKTGYLVEAKNNLVVELRPSSQQDAREDLIVVVLGSSDKQAMFASAKRLAEWGWQNFDF